VGLLFLHYLTPPDHPEGGSKSIGGVFVFLSIFWWRCCRICKVLGHVVGGGPCVPFRDLPDTLPGWRLATRSLELTKKMFAIGNMMRYHSFNDWSCVV
jgi:hypothetical protein